MKKALSILIILGGMTLGTIGVSNGIEQYNENHIRGGGQPQEVMIDPGAMSPETNPEEACAACPVHEKTGCYCIVDVCPDEIISFLEFRPESKQFINLTGSFFE